MSKRNPIVERAKLLRAAIEADIGSLEAQIAAKRAEAAVLDRLMLPTLAPGTATPSAEPKPPRATRQVKVKPHNRTLDAADPGPTLPITQEPT